jgi:hypothetical protein
MPDALEQDWKHSESVPGCRDLQGQFPLHVRGTRYLANTRAGSSLSSSCNLCPLLGYNSILGWVKEDDRQ